MASESNYKKNNFCEKQVEHTDDLEIDFSESSSCRKCEICGKNLQHMNVIRQVQHFHKCESISKERNETKNNCQTSLTCPVCLQSFGSRELRSAHMKKCGKKHGLSTEDLIKALRLQEKQIEERRTIGLPLAFANEKPKKKMNLRLRQASLATRKVDESMQMAVALSLSEFQKKKKDTEAEEDFILESKHSAHGFMNRDDNRKNLSKRAKSFRKREVEIPALLSTSPKSRQNITEKRFLEIISTENSNSIYGNISPQQSNESSSLTNLPSSELLKKSPCTRSFWKLASLVDIFELHHFYCAKLNEFIKSTCIVTGSKLKDISDVPGHEIMDENILISLISEENVAEDLSSSSSNPANLLSQKSSSHCVFSSEDIKMENELPDLKDDADSSSRERISKIQSVKRTQFFEKLVADYEKLLETSDYSDLTIITKDGVISAHKNILTVRCPVIIKDVKNDGFLNLCNYTTTSIKAFLKYLYCGVIDFVKTDELMDLSIKFECNELTNHFLNDSSRNYDEPIDENFEQNEKFFNDGQQCRDISVITGSRNSSEEALEDISKSSLSLQTPQKHFKNSEIENMDFDDSNFLPSLSNNRSPDIFSESVASCENVEIEPAFLDTPKPIVASTPFNSSSTFKSKNSVHRGNVDQAHLRMNHESEIINEKDCESVHITILQDDKDEHIEACTMEAHEDVVIPENFLEETFSPIKKHKQSKAKKRKVQAITPLPHYSVMETPELRASMAKYGLRKLPKKTSVKLLKRIYEETHPLVTDSENESVLEGISSSQQAIPTSKREKIGKFSYSQPNSKAIKSKANGQNFTKGLDQVDEHISSGNSTNDEECLEESIEASQQANCSQESNDIGVKLKEFIRSNVSLHKEILKYKPIPIEQFHEDLKKNGIKLSMKSLMDFLDQQCITFRFEKNERGRNRMKNKK